MKADEKELLDRIFAGEKGAFEQLLERYRSLFYSIFNAPGMGFPRDYQEDLFQGFVINLSARDYYKLRAFEGRNSASLATFLQIVVTRFTLDERRKFRRHPRGIGQGGREDDEPTWEFADPKNIRPDDRSLEREQLDTFYNLLFSLDWKRISAVLWVFKEVDRERIAVVMATSRANIDALFKRAKDQMTGLLADGGHSGPRLPDSHVLTPAVSQVLRQLLTVPTRQLLEGILQPGAKRRALLALVLLDYPRFCATRAELAKLAGFKANAPPGAVEAECLAVLQELAERVGAAVCR
jgi:DNA-directed RNA polymerase specialized sigma24 family protein